jgi:probable phosphoglycerate mutase
MRHAGRTDIPLTGEGEVQASGLAPWLARVSFSHVFTSPLQRARRTCELAGLGAAAEIEPDLAEWAYGQYEGELSAEVQQSRPGWNVFRDGCPGGEAPWQIHQRADRLIARLCSLSGDIALFSHAQFGCALAARWMGHEVLQAQHLELGTASVGVLSFSGDHPNVRVLALWNATPGTDP